MVLSSYFQLKLNVSILQDYTFLVKKEEQEAASLLKNGHWKEEEPEWVNAGPMLKGCPAGLCAFSPPLSSLGFKCLSQLLYSGIAFHFMDNIASEQPLMLTTFNIMVSNLGLDESWLHIMV